MFNGHSSGFIVLAWDLTSKNCLSWTPFATGYLQKLCYTNSVWVWHIQRWYLWEKWSGDNKFTRECLWVRCAQKCSITCIMEITDHVSYFVRVGSCLVFKCLGVYFAFWLSSLSLFFSFSLFDSLSLSLSLTLFLFLSLSFSFFLFLYLSFSFFLFLSLSFSFFLFLSLSFSFFLFISLSSLSFSFFLSLSLSLCLSIAIPRAGCAYFPCSLQHLGAGTFHFASQHFGWGDPTSSCRSLHVGTCVLALCMTCNIV